jgi:hypothetical protein
MVQVPVIHAGSFGRSGAETSSRGYRQRTEEVTICSRQQNADPPGFAWDDQTWPEKEGKNRAPVQAARRLQLDPIRDVLSRFSVAQLRPSTFDIPAAPRGDSPQRKTFQHSSRVQSSSRLLFRHVYGVAFLLAETVTELPARHSV